MAGRYLRPRHSVPAPGQRGAATLIVVAVLFFIASLVAAYTNRNLIFEQRTSGNQFRSTQALEAAEAGVEWALAMLNTGRIDANCAPTANPTLTAFRDRYLDINLTNGNLVPSPRLDPATAAWPTCVFDGTDWVCGCPENGPAGLAPPAGAGVFPAFRVTFEPLDVPRPGVVRLRVNGCTRLDADCLNFPATGVAGEGRASLDVVIALRSALPAIPTAAVTVRDRFDLEGTAFGASNPDARSGGLAIRAGGVLDGDGLLRIGGPAGTPAERALLVLAGDPALDVGVIAAPGARLFGALFGATPQTYRDQPAALVLDCSAAVCDADSLRAVVARNPGRIVWATNGVVTLDGGAAIGSAADPVLLVVDDDLELSNTTFNGLVLVRGDPAVVTGNAATLNGALLAENELRGGAGFDVVYDADALAPLRWRHGSFVRVPGGWRDF